MTATSAAAAAAATSTTSVCSLHPRSHQTSIRTYFARSSAVQPPKRPLGRPATKTKTDPAGSNKKPRPPNPIAPPHPALASSRTSTSITQKRISNGSSPNDDKTGPEPCCPIQQQQQRKIAVTKKATQQLYLDLGQRNFAKPIECAVCGMLFVHGLSEDAKRHAFICKDYQQGVTFAALDNLRVAQKIMLHKKGGQSSSSSSRAASSNSVTMVEIRPTDSYALRKKVAQIKVIVDQELGFAENGSGANNNSRTAFLAIVNKRTIGIVLVETIDTAYHLLLSPSSSETGDDDRRDSCTFNSSILERSHVPRRAVMGIHQIWVHAKFRSQGIASALVDTARSHMVFGYTIPAHQVAFSSPTESGVRFARRYIRARVPPRPKQGVSKNCRSVQRCDVLVYDCC